ncbi:MAG: immunoglobulin domain-containing protein, partial [Bacteroidales bacterium]|nr:immunoglobulin domain-containing protein [Bacteroidales bacterium]
MFNLARHITSFERALTFMKRLCYILAFSLIPFSFINGQTINNNGAYINVVGNSVIRAADFTNTSGGNVTNNGSIRLYGSYTNNATTQGDGLYTLMQRWINRGTFISGRSEVLFNGGLGQTVLSGGDPFFKLTINSSFNTVKNPSLLLEDDVVVTDTLEMVHGFIRTGSNVLYLSSLKSNSLRYRSTSNSRIIGDFKRGVGEKGTYLFPLGNDRNYDPITLMTNETPNSGTVLAQFFTSNPGADGLPIADPPVEVWNVDSYAYWRLTPGDYFISEDYNIEVTANGFRDTLFSSSRLIRRERGGLWSVDGTHVDADTINKIVRRANLETSLVPTRGTEFAIGRVRPRILEQPVDTAVCEGQNAFFKTSATGTRSLRYQWYKLVGGIGQQISRTDPHYSGVRTDSLTILNTTLDDIGYYFCLIRDRNNQTISTDTVYLHVGRVPIVTVTTSDQLNECSNIPIDDIIMHLSNYDEGTRFVWTRSTDSNITTDISETGTENDISAAIRGSFVNTSDNPITITFEIIPIGPAPTSCTGEPVYSNVTINPTPRLILADTTTFACYGTETAIELVSPTQMTTGSVVFDYSVTSENSTYLTGNWNPAYNQ